MNMETTTDQPTKPVCPMTWAELQNKGFEILDWSKDDVCPNIIHAYTWGETFVAASETDSLDQLADEIWNDFCDFINGRSN